MVQAIKWAKTKHFGFPKVPKAWQDLLVPPNLETTVREDRFLAFNEHVGGENLEKILIFCSNEQLDVLKSIKRCVQKSYVLKL